MAMPKPTLYEHEASTRYVRRNNRLYRVIRGYTYEVVPDKKAPAPVKAAKPYPIMAQTVYEELTGKTTEADTEADAPKAAKKSTKKTAKKSSSTTVETNADSD